MNKWLARILGIIIVAIVGLFFYDSWFNPPIPSGVANIGQEEGVVLTTKPSQDRAKPSATQESAANTAPQSAQTPPATAEPVITLTSLQDMESDHGAPVPVLANPQGTNAPAAPAVTTPAANAAQNQPLQLESLAAGNDNNRKPAAPASSPAPNSGNSGSTWIQAGAFGEKGNAERLAESIRGKKLPAVVEVATVNGKTFHRVYVGPIAANRVADVLGSLSAMGVNAQQINR